MFTSLSRYHSFFSRALLLGLCTAGTVASAQTAPQLLPYTAKVVAGGGTVAVAAGGTCPVSGYKATDAYGDGCLATEVLLGTGPTAPGPRSAVADPAGNVFFTDYVNGLVRRVDVITGIVTAVAGGATASPASAPRAVRARRPTRSATAVLERPSSCRIPRRLCSRRRATCTSAT